MSHLNENVLKKKLVDVLKSKGAKVLKLHGHLMQQAGWPDLFVAHSQWTGWIELKVDKRQLEKLQELCIQDLLDRGVTAFCLRYSNETGKFTVDGIEGFEWDEVNSGNVFLFLNTLSKLVWQERGENIE